MATLILDTYKAITQLKEAGFDENKAEAIINSLQEVNLESFASKQDLSNLETRLYKWGAGALIAQAALVVGLIQLLGN